MPAPSRTSSTDAFPLQTLSYRNSLSSTRMDDPESPTSSAGASRRLNGNGLGYSRKGKKRLSDGAGEGEALLGTSKLGEDDIRESDGFDVSFD